MGGYLHTRADVKRGIVERYPLRKADFNVERTGLPSAACINDTYCLSEGREMTLFANATGRQIGRFHYGAVEALGA